jgi:hypothetical protein
MEISEYYDSKRVSRIMELCRLSDEHHGHVHGHDTLPTSTVHVCSKRSIIKDTYFVTEVVLLISLSLCTSDATETSHLPVTTHAPQSVQLSFKSVNNKGQFTLEAEEVFRP